MKTIRLISIILLIFIGLNALVGGVLLVAEPSGTLLHMSIEQVEPEIFKDFLIPGVFLFFINGVWSIVTAVLIIFERKGYIWLMILQGIILFGWITAQIFFFEQIYFMQYFVAGIGLTIVICGIRMQQLVTRKRKLEKQEP